MEHSNYSAQDSGALVQENDSLRQNVDYEDDNQNDYVSKTPQRRYSLYRLLKTATFVNLWMCIGLWASTVTPCVDVLKDQIHGNYQDISKVIASKSFAIIFGSVIGGFLADKFQRWIDALLCSEVLIAGLAFAAIPWAKNMYTMTAAFVLNGLCQGGISAGGNAHAIKLWGADATAPMHLIHFGYGIGTVLGPVFMAPFLPATSNNTNTHLNSTALDYTGYGLSSASIKLTSRVQNNLTNMSLPDVKIPFAITGGLSVLTAIVLFVFIFFPYVDLHINSTTIRKTDVDVIPDKKKTTLKQIFSPGSCAGGDMCYGLQMIIMIFLFYVILIAKDTGIALFLQPIAVNSEHLKFTLKESDMFIMVFFICYACGQFIVVIIGRCIPIQVLLFVEMLGSLVFQVLLTIFGLKSRLNFWLTNCAFAIMAGPMFVSGMTWIDRYIKMTAVAFSVLEIGIGLSSFISTWLCGYIVDSHPYQMLYNFSLACGIAQLMTLIIMQARGSLKGDRYKQLVVVETEETAIRNDEIDTSETNALIQ